MNAMSQANYVFAPAAIPTLPVAGSNQVFPVRRLYCVGRNYAEHAIEMGHDPNREPPFFFQKNPDSITLSGEFPYPRQTKDVHHEIEMVVAIGRGGKDIPVDKALEHVFGYGVGLDMTRRDLQGEAKKLGRPWDIGKGFDLSAPIGPLHRAGSTSIGPDTTISLQVNGTVRQKSTIGKLIWSIAEIIEHLSAAWELQPGDLIFTGTPEGVAAVERGDMLKAEISGIGSLQFQIV